ncbi:coenzyme F420-0:L-glutamate ligase [Methylobacterium sp. NEAU 140]|nr:coenzyme F420-0:L-glutamate ligase [Methylobacterium sp. NEAU 140]MDP4022000.1 coenzyme F420-0:L-glutamate ligase [Methylobacterium sp. NEAU 140]
MVKQITYTALPGLPLVEPGDPLSDIVLRGVAEAGLTLADGDIIVVAQKIVSKSENRYRDLGDVVPGKRAVELSAQTGKDPRMIEAILMESSAVVRARPGVIVVEHRLGFVMANAGIDESNIPHFDGRQMVLLLPEDPDASAARLKAALDAACGASVGVVVNDSFGRPWRNGVVGVALGSAGLCSLASMIGTPDLFGRALRITEVAIGDELAAAASLLMGQGAERCPVIHVRGWKSSGSHTPAAALVRPRASDMFR